MRPSVLVLAALLGVALTCAGRDFAARVEAQDGEIAAMSAPPPSVEACEVGSDDEESAVPEEPTPASASGECPLDADGMPVLGLDLPVEDASGTALVAFHSALRRAAAGDGQARVVVYGASHVAADVWTGTVRRALQARFGDAGHGFVLPVEPWRHYRHLDIGIDSSARRWETLRARIGDDAPGLYGLAGVAVRTERAGAWGRLDTNTRTASRFELWYLRQPGGGTVDIIVDGERVRRVRTGVGEPGPGYDVVTTDDAHHTFEIRARGDGPVTVFGSSVEREAPGVVVDALGINGFRAAGQLLWDEALHAEHLRRRSPDLVVLAYGTNESGDDDQPIEVYEASLRRVLARVQGAVPTASCLLVGPSDRPLASSDGTVADRPRTAAIIAAQRRVAADVGCGFFDMVAFGGGPLHMVSWAAAEPAWAHDDLVHYTSRGYTRLGEVMTHALLGTYEGPMIVSAPAPTSTL